MPQGDGALPPEWCVPYRLHLYHSLYHCKSKRANRTIRLHGVDFVYQNERSELFCPRRNVFWRCMSKA
nr:MAG TPA: hypothetical protein [Caudoviricetes sp.]